MKANLKQQPEELAEVTKKISPKEYNMMLRHLDLEDVYLKDLKTSLNSKTFHEKASLDFNESPSLVKNEEGKAEVDVLYKLTAKCDKKKIFSMNIKYRVIFRLDTELPDEFFQIYNHMSLPIQTYPYFRELVNSIISKMGLPPLVLGLRKNLVG